MLIHKDGEHGGRFFGIDGVLRKLPIWGVFHGLVFANKGVFSITFHILY
jgi:hypothetical protein